MKDVVGKNGGLLGRQIRLFKWHGTRNASFTQIMLSNMAIEMQHDNIYICLICEGVRQGSEQTLQDMIILSSMRVNTKDRLSAKASYVTTVSNQSVSPAYLATVRGENLSWLCNKWIPPSYMMVSKCEKEIKRIIGVAKTGFLSMQRILLSADWNTRFRISKYFVVPSTTNLLGVYILPLVLLFVLPVPRICPEYIFKFVHVSITKLHTLIN